MPGTDINERIGDFIRDNTRLAVLLVILGMELAWVAAPAIVAVFS